MILRKPYAFLIKHFKFIHLILTVLLGFIMYQTNNIYTFFKEYLQITRNLKLYQQPLITSVKWYIYFALILAIIILSLIYFLMKKKKKPVKYYLYAIIFYVLNILALLFSMLQIFELVNQTATVSLVSAARDIMQMLYYGQYIFLFIALLRGIGFNIKQFNFESDSNGLAILEEDNEEFELGFEVDSDDVKTKLKRNIRMIRYFVLENKIVLVPVIVILGISLIVGAFLNREVYNKVYSQGETFVIEGMETKVLNTYETIKDYSGNDISQGKYIYYVVELEINNKTDNNKMINIDNVSLKLDEYNYYSPVLKQTSRFLDLGESYYEQIVKTNSKNKYILIFEIEKEFKNKTKILRYLIGNNSDDGFVYTEVKLKPKSIDKTEIKNTVNLKEVLTIENSAIGNLELKIEEYEIAPIMEYKYEEVINNKKYTFTKIIQPSKDSLYSRHVLKIKSNIIFNDIYNNNVVTNFISKLGNIRYVKDGKEYTNPFKMVDITPSGEKEYTYLEVYSEVQNAEQIYLDINIRPDKYVYKLK